MNLNPVLHRRGQSLLALLLTLLVALPALARGGGSHGGSRGGSVYVHGYTRSNGTYVAPHYRSAPDGNFYNNWSTKGNVNPYTGKEGTKVTPPAGYGGYGGSPATTAAVDGTGSRNNAPAAGYGASAGSPQQAASGATVQSALPVPAAEPIPYENDIDRRLREARAGQLQADGISADPTRYSADVLLDMIHWHEAHRSTAVPSSNAVSNTTPPLPDVSTARMLADLKSGEDVLPVDQLAKLKTLSGSWHTLARPDNYWVLFEMMNGSDYVVTGIGIRVDFYAHGQLVGSRMATARMPSFTALHIQPSFSQTVEVLEANTPPRDDARATLIWAKGRRVR